MTRRNTVLLVTAGDSLTLSPPLGLLQIAAAVRSAGAAAAVFDLTARPERLRALHDRATAPDVLWIGFSSFTPNLPAVRAVARALRAAGAAAPLVLGGIHATALPAATLAEGPWDAVVVGEGDAPAAEITALLRADQDLRDIAGVLSRTAPAAPVSPAPPPDLAAQPLPAWDLVDLADYQARPWQLVRRGRRVAPLLTTRGCPYRCRFCAAAPASGHRLRLRPVERIRAEVERLVRRHGVDELHILDDTFNYDLDHAHAVMDVFRSAPGPLHWKTPHGIRVDRGGPDFVAAVRASGGYQMGFGVESGDPGVLRANGKRLDLAAAAETIARYRAAGVSTFGYFVLGLPGETRASLARTARWAERSALDHVHASLAVPYPGSPLYGELRAAGRLTDDWARYRHTTPFPTCDLPPDEVTAALRRLYLRFYRHPRRALGLVREALRTGPRAFARVGWAYAGRRRAAAS